jgi:hypothetical protein
MNDSKTSSIGKQIPNQDSKTPETLPAIEPLVDFEWTTTLPTKLRPFKPVYNITMGMNFTLKL